MYLLIKTFEIKLKIFLKKWASPPSVSPIKSRGEIPLPLTYYMTRTSRRRSHSPWRITATRGVAVHFRNRASGSRRTAVGPVHSLLTVRGLSSGRCGQSVTARLPRHECRPDGKVTEVRWRATSTTKYIYRAVVAKRLRVRVFLDHVRTKPLSTDTVARYWSVVGQDTREISLGAFVLRVITETWRTRI